jgi:transcription initiation factor IIE alpha subunit
MIQRTSLEAKLKVEPQIGSINRKVYEFILNRGLTGATDQEIEASLCLDGNTVRPSRGSLVKNNLVADAGITRKNKKGNACIVWRATKEDMLL